MQRFGSKTTRRRRARSWAPAAFVAVILTVSLAVPWLTYARLENLRARREALAAPAREEIGNALVSLTLQISNFRGFLLTGDQEFVRRYREARLSGARALAALGTSMPRIDPRASSHLRRIEQRIARWHSRHEEVFAGRVTRESYVATNLIHSQTLFAEVAGELSVMRDVVRVYDARLRNETMRAVKTGAVAMASLVVIGLLIAIQISRLASRLEQSSGELERRTREEVAFRSVASRLNAVATMADVLRQVSESAVEITGADGAYVERVIGPEGNQVEVVATVGHGTPQPHTIVRFPGSLTAEMIARRQPAHFSTIRTMSSPMGTYLDKSCAACEVIVMPLFSEDHLQGALVIVAARRDGDRFSEDDLRRTAALGELAAVAMRRSSVLENEQRARTTAEEAVAARNEMLGIVSHDLRSPLTTILLALQSFDRIDEADELGIARDAAKRMQRLVDDLLDLARIESGHLSLKTRSIDPIDVVEETCRAFASAAAAKSIALVRHGDPELPKIAADPDRLMQALGNLLSNAIKFTPEGGEIEVEVKRSDATIEFRTTDSGAGIAAKDIPNVFQRHWQSKKTAHLGAGLGLTIAKGIVEAHGGSIRVESAPGAGATFIFTVPIR